MMASMIGGRGQQRGGQAHETAQDLSDRRAVIGKNENLKLTVGDFPPMMNTSLTEPRPWTVYNTMRLCRYSTWPPGRCAILLALRRA